MSGRERTVFCLGCGAETPPRVTNCPICGRRVSPLPDSSEATRETSPASSGARLATLTPVSFHTGLPYPSAAPAIPDATATGLPRDAAGRIALLTVVALAADLFAPWSVVYDQPKTMAASGSAALALLALFALAALPLVLPAYRARPHFAVAPLAVGAFCLGAGIFYWAILGRENAAALAQGASPAPGSPPVVDLFMIGAQSVIVPGVGLYLFLIGAAVLAFVGYHLFLHAALASARATAALKAHPASRQLSTAAASASMPLVTSNSSATAMSAPAAVSSPLAAVSIAESQPASSAAPSRVVPAPSAASAVVLPGSAAWNETPKAPMPVRPSRLGSSGWSRQAGVRR